MNQLTSYLDKTIKYNQNTVLTSQTTELVKRPNYYECVVLNKDKQKLRLELFEDSLSEVKEILTSNGLSIIDQKERFSRTKRKAVSPKELLLLIDAIASQIESGIEMHIALRQLSDSFENETLKEALMISSSLVLSGYTLGEAFEQVNKFSNSPVFPNTLITLLKTGVTIGAITNPETGQKINAISFLLKQYYEAITKEIELKSQIKNAMIYPIIVFMVALIAVLVASIFIMPVMKELYAALLTKNSRLPLITEIMLAISDFLRSIYGIFFFIICAASVFYIARWAKSESGSNYLKEKSLYLPLLKNFFRDYYSLRFLKMLAILGQGIPSIVEQLEVMKNNFEHPIYKIIAHNIKETMILKGYNLSKAFKPYIFLFGKDFENVLVTAEQTGMPHEGMYKYAKILERRVDSNLENVITIMKNTIIIPIAIIVALVAAAIFLPLFQLAGELATQR